MRERATSTIRVRKDVVQKVPVDSPRSVGRASEKCVSFQSSVMDSPHLLAQRSVMDSFRHTAQKSVVDSPQHVVQKTVMDSRWHHSHSRSPRPAQSLTKTGQWSDGALLYFTLVADGALPDGFLRDFLWLTPWVSAAAQRQAAQLARTGDLEAALFLHHDAERRKAQSYQEKSGAEQFITAASAPPTRFKSRLHHSRSQGRTARKDSEESERQRWLQLLANLLVGTDTPVGKLLQARQGDITVLGAGRRAGTIRSNTSLRSP